MKRGGVCAAQTTSGEDDEVHRRDPGRDRSPVVTRLARLARPPTSSSGPRTPS